MHSSRKRTARSSSRPGGSPSGTPPDQAPHPTPQNQTPQGPGTPPGPDPPPLDRMTGVNILPCPKLRLRAVITVVLIYYCRKRRLGQGNVFTPSCLFTGAGGGMPNPPPGCRPPGCRPLPPEIRSTSGRYASYWNAYLLSCVAGTDATASQVYGHSL